VLALFLIYIAGYVHIQNSRFPWLLHAHRVWRYPLSFSAFSFPNPVLKRHRFVGRRHNKTSRRQQQQPQRRLRSLLFLLKTPATIICDLSHRPIHPYLPCRFLPAVFHAEFTNFCDSEVDFCRALISPSSTHFESLPPAVVCGVPPHPLEHQNCGCPIFNLKIAYKRLPFSDQVHLPASPGPVWIF